MSDAESDLPSAFSDEVPTPTVTANTDGYSISLARFIINGALAVIVLVVALTFTALGTLWHNAPWLIALGALICVLCLALITIQAVTLLRSTQIEQGQSPITPPPA
jgi:protein-S-isoprenylcysteine O-methyltransferase Ste14